jgi:hypothetical protein
LETPFHVCAALHSPTPLSLESFRVGAVPDVYYIPDVVGEAEEAALTACSDSMAYAARWVQLRSRRLQNWGGTPPQTFETMPQWIREVRVPCVLEAWCEERGVGRSSVWVLQL